MRPHFTQILCGIAFALAVTPASAEEVTLQHNDLTLLADFVEAEDSTAPVALITHGTLAHKDMELVEALQEALAEQGVTSLAHTLSLGLDERRGMYDCAVPHTHREVDAIPEIAAWIDWLRERGVERVALVGHSRGAKQAARAASERNDLAGVVLLAPATFESEKNNRRGLEFDETLVGQINPPNVPLNYLAFLHCTDTKVSALSLNSYYLSVPRGAEAYTPDIAAPILVIAAGRDTAVPDVPATFMPLRSDMLHFALIEDADHMFLDFYAEDAATLIAEFLADLPATPAAPDFAAADLAYGEYLGGECKGCHAGGDGIPPIAGGDAGYLYEAMVEYADGTRENEAMRLVARSLDDEQRIAVAAYFASLDAD